MRVLDLTKPCGTHEAKVDAKEILPRRETPLEIWDTVIDTLNDTAKKKLIAVKRAYQGPFNKNRDDIAMKLNKERVNLITWHCCFGHLSVPNVIRAAKMVKDMDIKGLPIPRHACEPCRKANATVIVGKLKMTPATKQGQRVFINIGGGEKELPPSHSQGFKY